MTGTGRGPGRRRPTPRSVALRAVLRVTEEGAYSNLAVPAEMARAPGLTARDRQFASDLAYGTLRRLVPIDRALGVISSRPIDELDPEARALLRLGAYQLLHARVAAHAAVAETVEMARPRHRGYVNAVLRRLSREPPSLPEGDDDQEVSLRTGLAPWAVAELRRLLPKDEVEAAAAGLASPAGLTVRVNRCRVGVEDFEGRLRGRGLEPTRGSLHPEVLKMPGGAPALLPGYEEGWFVVQDEASAMAAAAVEARPGERVLDACAAPGGKATDLGCRVAPGGVLVAGEVNPGRAGLVKRTAGRLGVRALVVAQDATRPALRGTFDAVLVDAPCSGLGSARRRPELLWRPSRSDLSRLARLQVALLVGVADLVRPGGRLVYSVCTFPRAETDAAVRAFLAKTPQFRPSEVPGPGGRGPIHRLWPHRHATDAMFWAGFRREP